MKKSNINILKDWINTQPRIKTAAPEPTTQRTEATTPDGLNSKQRQYIKWKSKSKS